MKKPRFSQSSRRTVRPRSSRFVRKSLPLHMLSGLEPLEPRQMLAANVLASGESTLLAETQLAELSVETPEAPAGSEVILKIAVSPQDGSSLDPAAVSIFDDLGNLILGQTQTDDIPGSVASETVVSLPAGAYDVEISGEAGSSGGYRIEVSMLGDVADDAGVVSEFEAMRTSAAAVQFYGTGNFVTATYFNSLGIDLGVPQADPGMDGDGDGDVDGQDLLMVQHNQSMGRVDVGLQMDSDPPEFGSISLTNDTGTSDSDQITTDATTLVNISDESLITELTGSLNGGPAIDLTPLVGDFNTTGSFLLDPSDYEAINGGPLGEGVNTLSLTATDDRGNTSDPVSFSFTLISNNGAPQGSVPDQSTDEDSQFSLDLSSFFSDPNPGDVFSFSSTDLPGWASLSADGLLSGVPLNEDVGVSSVTISATDSQGLQSNASFELEVVNVNDPPVLSGPIPDQNAAEDTPFLFDFGAFFSDPDVGDTISYSVFMADGFDDNGNVINGGPLPDWLTANETTGILSGTPGEGDQGLVSIGIIAFDTVDGTTNTSFTIDVAESNDPPQLVMEIPDQTVNEDEPFSLNLTAFFSDPEGETLSLSSSDLPPWLTLGSAGVLSGTPTDGDEGVFPITITATDSFGESASGSFDVTAVNINDLPVIANQTFSVNPTANNGSVVGTVVATDDDVSDALTYTILSGNDDGAFALDVSNGSITVADQTALVDGNTEQLVVQVDDGNEGIASATMTIQVASNLPPVAVDDSGFSTTDNLLLDIDPSDLTSNDTDPDGDSLSVQTVALTSSLGATVRLVGGSILYDPSTSEDLIALRDGESLTDTFTYVVTDNNGGTDSATVSVLVNGADVARYRLDIVDGAGNSITTVATGETFELVAFVQDVQVSPQGIFSAFLDVDYTIGLITPDGSIEHSTTYGSGTAGSNVVQGFLDEVGGVDGLSPLGGNEFEVFRQTFTAGSTAGVVTFNGNETEDQIQHPTLVFGDTMNLPNAQIDFGSTMLTVTSAGSESSSAVVGGFLHNADNPFDVNGDSSVSPLDALLVINALESGASDSDLYLDVNADQGVSPMDALLVINELLIEQNAVSAGVDAGGVNTGADSDVGTNELAAALDTLFGELGDDLSSGLSIEDLQADLSPELVNAIYEVLEADEDEQDALWSQLADDLAIFLNSDLG